MIQELLWGISFIGLWLTLTWLNFLHLPRETLRKTSRLPTATIVMPCYNRESTLEKTVRSLMALDYPAEKVQLIIVDDGSTDGTAALARSLQKEFPRLEIIRQANGGKDAALNTGLNAARGEFFACVDSDTRVEPQSLRAIVSHFDDKKIGAVISVIKVDDPCNTYEHIQRVEYIFSNLVRRIMSAIDTLFVTPGALSAYRTQLIKDLGGFGGGGLTEDLEIALRLRKNGYRVVMETDAVTHTKVPCTFHTLYRQRIRWFRGFMFNHWKYRAMLFNPRFGLFGMFQYPLNIAGVLLLLLTLSLVGYGMAADTYQFVYRSITIPGYFMNHVLETPTLRELFLGQNAQIVLPLIASLILGLYLMYVAHRELRERVLPYVHFIWIYMLVFPYVTGLHWFSALYKEIKRSKRTW